MKTLGDIKYIINAHLFSSIPEKYEPLFSKTIYYYNLNRFLLQSLCILFVDLISLALFLVHYAAGLRPFFLFYVIVHLYKCLCNFFWVWYLRRREKLQDYKETSGFHKNFAFLFQAHAAINEFLLFITGPQDLGSLFRFFVGPFILAAVAIMKQSRAFILEMGIHLMITGWLVFRSAYSFNYLPGEVIFNAFFVSCFCANLVAYTVYSSHVNNFVHQTKNEESQEALTAINAQLDQLYRQDPLTGLSNKRDLDLFFERVWRSSDDSGQDIIVAKLDIDYFKAYSERYGFTAGDSALVRVSQVMADVLVSDNCLVCRTGGDDFVAVAYGVKYNSFLQKLETLRVKVENLRIENPDSDLSPYLTLSGGVAAVCLDRHWDKGVILQWADESLFFAKQNGRNRVVATQGERKKFTDARGTAVQRDFSQGTVQPGEPGEQEPFYESLRKANADYTFVYDRARRSLEFSEMASEFYGLPLEIKNPSFVSIISTYIFKTDRRPFVQTLRWGLKNKRKSLSTSIQFLLENENVVWLTLRMHCVYDEREELVFAAGSFLDMNSMIQYSNYIRQQETRNTITNLANRKKFYEDLQRELTEEENYGYLLFIDISNFNLINRMYSHSMGDKVLREVASILKQLSQKNGGLYNYSVDQFIVIARKSSPEEVEELVQEILLYFKQQYIRVNEIELRIAFSMGAARYQAGLAVIEDLLVDLEITVQKVKLEEQQRFAFFSLGSKIEYLSKVNLEREITGCVEDGFRGFEIHYQPIIQADSFQCAGAEALMRWVSPDGGIVSPAYIIPILEKTGHIVDMEAWLFRRVSRQLRGWIDRGIPDDFFIHINLSSSYITRPSLFEEISGPLKENDLGPENILLEVTESSLILDMQKSINTLNHLHQQGFRIAVDDFGTGYSSLSYLKTLPVDEIKIDKSFVANVEQDEMAKELFTAVVHMVKNMAYQVCVEGVETQEQLDIITGLGVDYLQGYYFSKPLTKEKFEREILEAPLKNYL